MPRGDDIPTAPGGSGGGNTTPPSGGSGSGSGSSGSGGSGYSGSGSSSSGGGSGYSNPYAYAEAQQRKADREAARKYLDQAATLQLQVQALRLALGKKGFKQALEQKLQNIGLVQRQSALDLVRGYRERVGGLKETAADNEAAAAGQAFANTGNASRERANAVSEATLQGAGESDLLRAQEMSLRNWNANQNEINRSFFDTQTSINASLGDLTVDTRTARINNVLQANADREQMWTTYYDQRSETLTQLGNVLGQQAEYYGLAQEAVSTGKTKRKRKAASQASGDAFTQAAHVAGLAWENPGVSRDLRKWDGAEDFEGEQSNSVFIQAPTELARARPEGATLREWAS